MKMLSFETVLKIVCCTAAYNQLSHVKPARRLTLSQLSLLILDRFPLGSSLPHSCISMLECIE